MASTLERCGDYARNVAKRTFVLEEFRYSSTLNGTLRRMSRVVESMLADALDAYVSRDQAKAEDVIERDLEADQIYNSLFRELLTHMMEDPRTIAPAMHLHFIAKNIERVGDHATSLSEQAIYLITGAFPNDDRPKQDVTSVNLSELRDE
jgi:phosphate transport system protein